MDLVYYSNNIKVHKEEHQIRKNMKHDYESNIASNRNQQKASNSNLDDSVIERYSNHSEVKRPPINEENMYYKSQ